MTRFLIALAVAYFCSACASGVQHATPSGHSEVTVSKATPDKVKAVLVNKMINKGYRITKDTQFELAFDKPVDNVMVSVLLGSKYDSQPSQRVSYSIAQVGEGVRVVSDFAVITNPGSAFERRTDVNKADATTDVQTLLEEVASELKGAPPVPSRAAKT
jgi:hypothetical protein